jgi:Trk K+ transport system NAD-binding subunit
VGAGLAIALAERGETVSVVDKDRRTFERLGERFPGHAAEGIAFDRDVLEQAGVARADDPGLRQSHDLPQLSGALR